MPSAATKASPSTTIDPLGAMTLAEPQEDAKSISSSESLESSTSTEPPSDSKTDARPKRVGFRKSLGKVFGKKKKNKDPKNKESEYD